MGVGGQTSTTSNQIPPELKALYMKSAKGLTDYQGENPLTGFSGSNPRQFAGASGLELGAQKLVPQLWDKLPGLKNADAGLLSLRGKNDEIYGAADRYGQLAEQMRTSETPRAWKVASGLDRARGMAAEKVNASAEDIANDAALQASQKAFKLTSMPMIANQMASMGLGRSTDKGKITQDAWMKNATPHIQDAIGREQARINKMTDTEMGIADRNLNLGQFIDDRQRHYLGERANAIGMKNQNIQTGMGIAGQQAQNAQQRWNQMKGAIDTGMGVGGTIRGIEDAQYKANYDDFLRRQGLSEKALYAPFGQAGNMVGSKTTTGK